MLISMRTDSRRYSQAGTPQVTVAGEYDGAARTFTLHVSQRTPATPGQSDKGPVPIPIAVGLLGADGQELPLHLQARTVSKWTWVSCGLNSDAGTPTRANLLSRVAPTRCCRGAPH